MFWLRLKLEQFQFNEMAMISPQLLRMNMFGRLLSLPLCQSKWLLFILVGSTCYGLCFLL